uniref:LNS2/PITP domain-containing protein n=1 Tax=Peronospora matthiolae TaxID=2874970 RepID=A0AAV1THY0_9STRA
MNVIYSVKDYVSHVFQPDSSSGAIDVVAVQQADGSLRCSPFYVHFGPCNKVVTQDEKPLVTLEMNGQVVDGVRMKLDRTGEAYFVHQVHDLVDEHDYATSPLSSPSSSNGDAAELDVTDSFVAEDLNGLELEEDAGQGLRKWTWRRDARPIVQSKHDDAAQEEKWLPGLGESESMYFDAVDIEAAGREDGSYYNHPSMSLCGHLLDGAKEWEDIRRIFFEHLITFDVFRANSARILVDPSLRFFVDGKVVSYDADMQAYLASRVLFPYSQHLLVGASSAVNNDVSTKSQAVGVACRAKDQDDGDMCIESAFTSRSALGRGPIDLDSLGKVCSDDGASTQDTASVSSEPCFRKSLRPSQEELLAMGLRVGINEIAFVLTSRGTNEIARVTASLYLWPVTTKVVIAQIDGAISSRAATGSMFRRKDPAAMHSGAVGFYTKLVQNGYQVVYVTCRGLSQVNLLHTLLGKTTGDDGDMTLPTGPVLFSPDRLLPTSSLGVIDVQDFKVAALDALRSLFPRCLNPFYAAFGTTETDSIELTQAGVFPGKVFIVNPASGSLRHHSLTRFQESYESLVKRMDTMFPPVYSPMMQLTSTSQIGFQLAMQKLHQGVGNPTPGISLITNQERLVSDAVASLVRTRSFADEAYNDVNFWRIEPGIV